MKHRCLALALMALAGTAASLQAAEPEQSQSTPGPLHYQPGTIMNPESGVVATVDGRSIYLPEIADSLHELPEDVQQKPFEILYPSLLEAAVNGTALLLEAQRKGLDTDPAVRRRMTEAANRELENELLRRVVAQQVTEAAIQARYNQRYAGLPGIAERRLRIMIFKTEQEAVQAETELAQGADFATLAKQRSIDPSSINGGEIGFVQQAQLPPVLAKTVFELADGAVSPEPMQNHQGWDVIKVEERRLGPVPALDEVRGAIKNELVHEAILQEVQRARNAVTVHEFNMDGTPFAPPSQDVLDEPLKLGIGHSR